MRYGAPKSGFTNKTVVFLTDVLTSATASCLGVETFLPLPVLDMHPLGSAGGKNGFRTHPCRFAPHCGSNPPASTLQLRIH